ncbi:MAG: hypothetical protein H7Y59_20675 [Anaerolineales bacterium]|nr:hypothetical protein [Anaerolineales bacterium]
MPKDSQLVNSILQVFTDYEETWDAKLRDKAEQIRQLEQQVAQLESELLEAVTPDDIIDEALKDRLLKLKSAPLDTTLREAGVVLESRLRKAGGDVDKTLTGVHLVDAVFNLEKGRLIFSDHPTEQEGIRMLFRGAIQFVRNPPMHKLIDYQEGAAKTLIRLIDSLLVLLEEGKPRITDKEKIESTRLMLKRRPLSKGQRLLFQMLAQAGDVGMTNSELSEAMGISRPSLGGLLGALGYRITHTQGLTSSTGIGDIFAITPAENGELRYQIRPILLQALKAEKIIP